MCAVTVNVAHKLLQSVLGVEDLCACLSLVVRAHVGERDADAGIEVCQFAHAARHHIPLEGCRGEDGGIGPELLARAPLGGLAHGLHGIEGLALLILLLIDMAVTVDLRKHVRGQGIDTTHAHSMQTTRHLVRVLVELTASVEHSHHDLQGTLVQLLVLIDGDAASVVFHGATAIRIEGHLNVGAIACHGLVDTVVHGLVDEMVETLLRHVADVHGRSFANGLKAFKHLDVGG